MKCVVILGKLYYLDYVFMHFNYLFMLSYFHIVQAVDFLGLGGESESLA